MHPVFPGCGVIKKGPGGVSCPVLISKYTIMDYEIFTFEIFMKSSKLSCTLSLKSKERAKGYGYDFENN